MMNRRRFALIAAIVAGLLLFAIALFVAFIVLLAAVLPGMIALP